MEAIKLPIPSLPLPSDRMAGLPQRQPTRAIRDSNGARPSQSKGNPRSEAALQARANHIRTYESYVRTHRSTLPCRRRRAQRRSSSLDPSRSQKACARRCEYAEHTTDKVVVRWLDHSGQYGRTTLGGDAPEADAVISPTYGQARARAVDLAGRLGLVERLPGYVLDLKLRLTRTARNRLFAALRTRRIRTMPAVRRSLAGCLVACRTRQWLPPNRLSQHGRTTRFNQLEEAYACRPCADRRQAAAWHIMRTRTAPAKTSRGSLMNEAAASRAPIIQFRNQQSPTRV